jgi:exonuclease VII small subunit
MAKEKKEKNVNQLKYEEAFEELEKTVAELEGELSKSRSRT